MRADPSSASCVSLAASLHADTLIGSPFPALNQGHWWFVRDDKGDPVAFLMLHPSDRYPNAGYFCRVGVLPNHRGHGLQFRLMGVMERKAKRLGWTALYSDTLNNPHSARNFVKRGWWQFQPQQPWAHSGAIYWMRDL
jgi:GNAT superfamily N-acetyltransferase